MLALKVRETLPCNDEGLSLMQGHAGGSLDLHDDTGLLALREAELFDEFKKHARYEGEDIHVVDRFGKTWVDIRDMDTGRPEIDRVELRNILLDSVPEHVVRWGCHLRSAEPGKLNFDHGDERGFDLIIGADGAWSKIRPLVCAIKPFYSGISMVELHIPKIDHDHPTLARMVGNGSYFAFGEDDGRALLSQRLGDGSLRIYAAQKQPENWIKTCGIDFSNCAEVREAVQKDFAATWAPQFLELIDAASEGEVAGRALYMLPIGLTWTSQPAVTVLGDAAHLMTPFAGEGVNAAMLDALTLARAIIKQPEDMATAIREYEALMFVNAREKTQRTFNNLEARFRAGGCAEFKARVDKKIKAHGLARLAQVAPELSGV